jgi:hypothetical protein
MAPPRSQGRRIAASPGVLLLLTVLAGCGDGGAGHEPPEPAAKLDPCGGLCTEVELCVPDRDGNHGCARICANQLRCWSGCCLPLGETGYNVCRPTNYCFPE